MVNEIIASLKDRNGTFITFHQRKRVEFAFPEIYSLVEGAAAHLAAYGLMNESVVGIIGMNDFDWVIADLACVYCGIKLLPLELEAHPAKYHDAGLRFDAILISGKYKDKISVIVEMGITCIKMDTLQEPIAVPESFVPYHYQVEEVFSYKSTSGSTGMPKVIGHTVMGVTNSISGVQQLFAHSHRERILVFLPMNLLQQRYWLYSAVVYEFTVIIVPKNYLFTAIKLERPSVIMGVPYIYEFIHAEFMKHINADKELATAYDDYTNQKTFSVKGFSAFADFLGGAINYLWTGSAPIDPQLVQFYFDMGVPLYQGYGMNETCIIAKNYPGNNKIGSVGRIFPNVEVRFDEQQQILVRNKYPVCNSYRLSSPWDQLIFDTDGYVHTGDIGAMDEDGYLYIHGRKKEMIVLSNSKKIFPRPIEDKIQEHALVRLCMLYGDKKPYLTALIVPATNDISNDTLRDIVRKYNESAAPEEQVYKFFTVNEVNEELLTNQYKVKRNQVYQRYKNEYNKLYE